jgi:lysophospholipid acyltransferase (LPLAT)-like uncharacterized protein
VKLRHPALAPLLPRGLHAAMVGIFATCRQTEINLAAKEALLAQGRSILYTCWHGQLAYFIYKFRTTARSIVLLASPSADGELIAQVAARFGAHILYGSRQKGGLSALRRMAAHLRQGYHGGIIADGSRGPYHQVQKGLILLAKESGAPVLPMAVASDRRLILNTWDRFEVILPFSRIALVIGEPLNVPTASDSKAMAACRQILEDRLRGLYDQCQAYSFPAA